MKTIDILNRYKELIFAFIVLGFWFLSENGLLSTSLQEPQIRYLCIIVIVVIIYISEMLIRLWRKKVIHENMVRELETDLARNRQKAIVMFRNAPMQEILPGVSKLVHAREWWDWSYIGIHPDCGGLCCKLFQELTNVYLSNEHFSKIQTSAITFFNNYPFRDICYIFIGDLVISGDNQNAEQFPDDPWTSEISGNFKTDFAKLYIIKTAWHSSKPGCVITKIKIEREPEKIIEQWEKNREIMKTRLPEAPNLVWTSQPPEADKKGEFVSALEVELIEHCDTQLFVISKFSGNFLSIGRYRFFRDQSKKLVSKLGISIILAVGWILSPLSFYNDVIVNIPIALYVSFLFSKLFGWHPTAVAGIAYVFTNLLGIALIYLGVRKIKPVKIRVSFKSIVFTFIAFWIVVMVIGNNIIKSLS